MTSNQELISASIQSNFDTLGKLSQIIFSSFEQTTHLNLKTVRSYLDDTVSSTKSLLAIRSAQDAASLQSSLAQPALEKAVAYSRSLYEISSQTQASISKLAEARYADINQSIASLIDLAAKSAPAGSEVGIAAVKSVLSAANSAFDNASQAGKRVAAIAEANAVAASSATTKAVTSAIEASQRKRA